MNANVAFGGMVTLTCKVTKPASDVTLVGTWHQSSNAQLPSTTRMTTVNAANTVNYLLTFSDAALSMDGQYR